jgi:hypothetical protein
VGYNLLVIGGYEMDTNCIVGVYSQIQWRSKFFDTFIKVHAIAARNTQKDRPHAPLLVPET